LINKQAQKAKLYNLMMMWSKQSKPVTKKRNRQMGKHQMTVS
jgi:hypothetical protein